MIVTALEPDTLAGLAAGLDAAGLPAIDLLEPDRRFFRFEDDAGVVGFGGLEGVGADRLLRSLVVMPDRRGRGSGSAILAAVEHAAADDGVARLYLLTTTAEPFFGRHGYHAIERADAPAAIAASAEFRSLCPASAAFLFKRIA
jgi:N-acetylglutamate synthase-like GNAT family acetyltransferase